MKAKLLTEADTDSPEFFIFWGGFNAGYEHGCQAAMEHYRQALAAQGINIRFAAPDKSQIN